MNKIILFILISLGCCFSRTQRADLAIQNVSVFNVETGGVEEGQTVLITDDTISAIIPASERFRAKKSIQQEGNLIVPGFIDTHIHLTDIVGDYENAPDSLNADSLTTYRERLRDTYIPYGVTTVLSMGHPEAWLPAVIDWSKNPLPKYPDLYTCGGAFISDEERTPYVGHMELKSPADAEEKVRAYHSMGIEHIKVYWRLRYPEMSAVLRTVDELGMTAYGHIDQNITFIDSTLNLGLQHYEHIHTLGLNTFIYKDDYQPLMEQMKMHYRDSQKAGFHAFFMEMFHYLHKDPEKINSLIRKMAEKEATLSTAIHTFAENFDRTDFRNPLGGEFSVVILNESEMERAGEGFDIMMSYLLKAHKEGIQIRIGTDCPNGGKSFISEQLILADAGFSAAEILQISTINGARAIKKDSLYGSIDIGKKANLIIYEKSPLENSDHFQSQRVVIKDGEIVQN